MIKLGMIIGDRYEILERIGTGGMSDVYKAKCHKLNRYVAVKVLKQEFSENENFVNKFRVEAQAAAGLEHPNIVNIYDVGEENGIYYIIMELVEGITLKQYIEKKVRISYKEAISIAIQVAMGIKAAHANKIIHRDIKPQNIIISTTGKVKVTDFGIAKAATSNTVTSNVMGSVHYSSPEQARGGYSDEKSDIYSLGITLFEMLTGRVPFNGDTTVAIAIKHIQEDMPSPRSFVDDVPISLEQIIFKCTQKSPDKRYLKIDELIKDLKQVLMNPDHIFENMSAPISDNTTRKITSKELNSIKIQSEQLNVNYADPYRKKKPDASQRKKNSKRTKPIDPEMQREKTITIVIVIVTVLLGLGIIFFVGRAVGLFQFGAEPEIDEVVEDVIMIDIDNLSWDDAKARLDEVGIAYAEPSYENSEDVTANHVISASIEAGDKVLETDLVEVVVSLGQKEVLVPLVLGLSEDEAVQRITDAGFKAEVGTLIDSPDYAKDEVGYQSIAYNEKAVPGTTIKIRVSKGTQYYLDYTLLAPSMYVAGSATIVVMTSKNEELFREVVTSFPQEIQVDSIWDVEDGKISVLYTISVLEDYLDNNGNPQTRTIQKDQEDVIEVQFEQR